jgi:hypothetical protein
LTERWKPYAYLFEMTILFTDSTVLRMYSTNGSNMLFVSSGNEVLIL